MLFDQPFGQFRANQHGPVLALGEGDQLRLLGLGEHALKRLFRPLNPLPMQLFSPARTENLMSCHP
jgi:hypothetical protein